jgi:hypothetical protein
MVIGIESGRRFRNGARIQSLIAYYERIANIISGEKFE